MMVPTHQDILDAARRIKGKILRTPFIFSEPLSQQVNTRVYLKLESLQPGGSFKFRGANNAVTMLTPKEREKGVVAASSGNHGTALALAASRVGIKATIVLPDNAPQVKVERIKKAGATILRHGSHYGDSEEKAAELGKEELVLIHPFDDPRVVAAHRGFEGRETSADYATTHLCRQPVPSLYWRHLIRGGYRSNQAGDSPYRGRTDRGSPLLPGRTSPGCGAWGGSRDIRPLGRENREKEWTSLRCGKRIELG